MRSPIVLISLCSVLLGLSSGCSTMTKNSPKDSPWRALQFWKKGYQQPTKMAVMWSHDVLSAPGSPPTRGFGGRIYFYNDKSQTVPVDGELIVHGFDDTQKRATGADPNVPDKRFRFTSEQFTKLFSESDLGASYSVWIPWDEVDGVQKEITLVPTFRGAKGEMVQGAPAKAVLPGRAVPGTQPVQTVAYEQSSEPLSTTPIPRLRTNQADGNSEKRSETMRTTTIKLSSPLERKSGLTNNPTINTPQNPGVPMQANSIPMASQNAVEQARAQMIAEALRGVVPQSSTNGNGYAGAAATHMQVPNMQVSAAGSTTPGLTQSSWTPSFGPTTGQMSMNNMPGAWGFQPLPAANTQLSQPPMKVLPPTNPSAPMSAVGSPQASRPQSNLSNDPVVQMQQALADESFGLPPGVQLTPRSPW